MMQNLIPKMTDLAVTEVDEKQQQRLETFLNTKKKLGEPKNDPDEYEKIRELGMLIKVLSDFNQFPCPNFNIFKKNHFRCWQWWSRPLCQT